MEFKELKNVDHIKFRRVTNLRKIAVTFDSVQSFADTIGKSENYTSALLNGHGSFGNRITKELESKLELRSGSLDYEQRQPGNNQGDFSKINLMIMDSDGPAKVPLVTSTQAATWQHIRESFKPAFGQVYVWAPRGIYKGFALRMEGDTMTNPSGAPSIPDGYVSIIDPDAGAKSQDLVVATVPGAGFGSQPEATIKRFVIDGPRFYLSPLNPRYSPIEIEDTESIVGVVKKISFDL